MRISARQCPFCKKVWSESNIEKYKKHLDKEHEKIRKQIRIKELIDINNNFVKMVETSKSLNSLVNGILNSSLSIAFIGSYAFKYGTSYIVDDYLHDHYNKKLSLKNIFTFKDFEIKELYIQLNFEFNLTDEFISKHFFGESIFDINKKYDTRHIKIERLGWCSDKCKIKIYKSEFPETCKFISLYQKLKNKC